MVLVQRPGYGFGFMLKMAAAALIALGFAIVWYGAIGWAMVWGAGRVFDLLF